jgi:hypothetical protein
MHPQYDVFKQWGTVKRHILEDRLADRFILFGEWVFAPRLIINKLLCLIALADTRGRTAVQMTQPEENLHLWRLVAEENDCFDRQNLTKSGART